MCKDIMSKLLEGEHVFGKETHQLLTANVNVPNKFALPGTHVGLSMV